MQHRLDPVLVCLMLQGTVVLEFRVKHRILLADKIIETAQRIMGPPCCQAQEPGVPARTPWRLSPADAMRVMQYPGLLVNGPRSGIYRELATRRTR